MVNALKRGWEVLKVLHAMGPAGNRNDVMLVLAAMQPRNDPFPEVRKARGRRACGCSGRSDGREAQDQLETLRRFP